MMASHQPLEDGCLLPLHRPAVAEEWLVRWGLKDEGRWAITISATPDFFRVN